MPRALTKKIRKSLQEPGSVAPEAIIATAVHEADGDVRHDAWNLLVETLIQEGADPEKAADFANKGLYLWRLERAQEKRDSRTR